MKEKSDSLSVKFRLLWQVCFTLQGSTSTVTARYIIDMLSFASLLQMWLMTMYSTEKWSQWYPLKHVSKSWIFLADKWKEVGYLNHLQILEIAFLSLEKRPVCSVVKELEKMQHLNCDFCCRQNVHQWSCTSLHVSPHLACQHLG